MNTKRQAARQAIKSLIIEKGIDGITSGDLVTISRETGANTTETQNAINYFRFSPQAAKYRTRRK